LLNITVNITSVGRFNIPEERGSRKTAILYHKLNEMVMQIYLLSVGLFFSLFFTLAYRCQKVAQRG
jgi:hypothetical protein